MSKRVELRKLSMEVLKDLMKEGTIIISPEGRISICKKGLPDDAILINFFRDDSMYDILTMGFEHESFEEIEKGGEYPIVENVFVTLEERVY